MKIAYSRFNQYCELDYAVASASSLGTELRVGILHALVEMGHDVDIVTPIGGKHIHALCGESKGDYDNTWMRALSEVVQPDGQNYDVIFVETAALNSMYGFSLNREKISFIQNFVEFLYTSQGVPIILYQHGPKSLSFPLWRVAHQMDNFTGNVEELSAYNYRRIFDFDILDGYDYHVWHHAPDTDSFLRYFGKDYNLVPYNNIISTQIAYDPLYDKLWDPRRIEDTQYDLAFVGAMSTAYREERVRRYYDDPRIDSKIVGRGWDKLSFNHNVTTPGKMGHHGDAQSLYQDSLACVLIANKEMATAGLATTRHIQTIRGGTFTMIDDCIYNPEWWMGTDEFVVGCVDDVVDMLDEYCDDYTKLCEVMEYQQSLLKRWIDVVPEVLNSL